MTKFLLAAAAAAACVAAPASAAVVFDLDNVVLVDGGSLVGSITLSDDLNSLLDFAITSSTNSSSHGNYVGTTYTPLTATGVSWNTTEGLNAQFYASTPMAQLSLFVVPSLDSTGALLSSSASEWQLTGGTRWVTSGELRPQDVSGIPEPATWALLIAGFGLIGASMRRRAGVQTRTA